MSIFQKVTLKTLKENKTRTIVTIIGIILSLSMFTAVTASVSSFQNYLLEVTMLREGNWHGSVPVTEDEKASLLSNENIETVSFLEHLGYARLTDSMNPDKPYLFIGGMDENANGTLPIILTKGRMPENENEILLPEHLSYNGGVNYELSDTLNLEIGQRLSTSADGTTYSLGQYNSYLYTKEELLEQGLSEETIAERETESLSVEFTHTYIVVGFYERPSIEPYIAPGYTALTISTAGEAGTSDNSEAYSQEYTAYIRFKNTSNIVPWMEENYPDSYNTNTDLLRMYGASYESSYNGILYGLASVLIFIILFGSVSLIYNAFSISVTERTKQFGLLASLGATKKQLIRSVLFEAFCLCIIGIPLGILAGIIGMGITFLLLGPSISEILFENISISLTLYVSPAAIICAALLGLLTVLFSAYLPARRATKLSPMEAVRLTADINIRPGKVKTSRLMYRLFGLPGVLASKNFKRNRKKYRATVLSLFVSIVLFISASSFCSYLLKATDAMLADVGCDIVFHRYPDDSGISNDALLDTLLQIETVDNAAWAVSDYVSISLQSKDLSQEYLDLLSENPSAMLPQNGQNTVNIDARIFFINDSSYAAYLKEIGLSPALFMNPERPLAIANDFLKFYQDDSGTYKTLDMLNSDSANATILQVQAPEGYQFNGYYTDENNDFIYYFSNENDPEAQGLELPSASCTTEVPLIIGAVPETAPFFLGNNYSNSLILLYPVSVMENVLGTSQTAHLYDDYGAAFYFAAKNHMQAAADISEALPNPELNRTSVYNYAENAAQERTLYLIITVFSYGFIILISLIAMANVFNTISTNIQLRKREFAMLKSTGMTPKGFGIMMCYECLLYGIKGLLYGLPVSILVTYWIYRAISSGLEMRFYIPWYSLVIAIGSVFLVVGSTMLYSMHKIGKENIMDNLKNDNL